MKRFAPRILGWLVLLIPLVGITSPPLPEPWYEFQFWGHLERTGGGALQGYPVVLVQDSIEAPYWKVLHSCAGVSPYLTPVQDVALTDANGFFKLHIILCYPPHDTLAVAVVLPDTIIAGSQVDRRQIHYWDFTQNYSYRHNRSWCTDNTVEFTHLTGYSYDAVDSMVVRIP